jgi:hypothetical protein
MFLTDRANGYLERWTSTDGISFTFQENVIAGGSEYKNPFVWFNPNDNKWYLYYHDADGSTEYIKVRSAANIEDLDAASSSTVMSRSGTLGSPSVMYRDGYYWLAVEVLDTVWKVRAFYSTSPTSGFTEASNSPILTNDEACAMHFLSPDGSKAYLFSNRDSANWYQDTREIYFGDHDETVELGAHCRTDFGDVRFTRSDGSTLLDYWMEEKVDGDYAVFWVEVADDLSTNAVTIYIYYGNSTATTTSNGNNTFLFFDDFNVDLSKWTVVSGTWTISNGELVSATTDDDQIRSADAYGNFANVRIRSKYRNIQNNVFYKSMARWSGS